MRVFLVGATGVLGRALVPLLLQQEIAIRTLMRGTAEGTPLPAGVEVVPGDLLTPSTSPQLPTMIAGCDAVVHIATAIPRDPAAPGAWDVTGRLRTEGTRALLDASLRAGVTSYLQMSIVMCYPDGGDLWLAEGLPIDTSSNPPVCKPLAAMEQMVRSASPDRLRWSILRGGRFVGPDTDQDALLARLRSGAEIVRGDGRNFVSLVNVADFATAVVAALEHAPTGSILNVVDEPIRYGAYVDRLAILLGVPTPIRDPARPLPPSHRCSNAAARAILHWTPTHGIWPALDHGAEQ